MELVVWLRLGRVRVRLGLGLGLGLGLIVYRKIELIIMYRDTTVMELKHNIGYTRWWVELNYKGGGWD